MMFEANVEGGQPPTNNLTFELRGDGTVPTITLEGPPLEGGAFDFGKHHIGRREQGIEFVMRNDGHWGAPRAGCWSRNKFRCRSCLVLQLG